MVQVQYDFPLPNNGERYDLSLDELIMILNHVYDCGFENARNIYDPTRQVVSTYASYTNDDDDDWDRPLTMSNDQWR